MSNIPKGYKQTEVGVIPEDWGVTCLRNIGDITRGASPRPIDSPIWFNEQSQIGWLRISDVTKSNKYLKETTQNLSALGVKHSRYVEKNNLVMSICATVGRPILTQKNVCIHDGFVVFSNLKIDKEYLYYILSSIEKDWSKHGQTGSQMNLNTGLINSTVIPLPPTKAEQTAIATALSDADALIQSLEKLIAKKRNVKQGAMQELLKPKEGWVVKKLGEIADSNTRWSFTGGPFGSNLKSSDYTDDGIRIIQLQNIGDGEFINDYEIYTSETKANELLSCNIYPGDIILSKMGDPVARACIMPDLHHRYLMCSDGIRLAVDKKNHNTYFIYEYINSPQFRILTENASTGSTRKRIGLNELRSINITCPDLTEQTRIATILSDMDREISVLETKLAKYKQVKQGMMQRLLTGNIRLLNIEASAKPKATVTVMPVQIDSQKKKHNWEFNEAVVISVLTKAFGKQSYPLGRKRYTKFSYLLHRYAERNAEGYLKKAAGPYNPDTRYKGPEKIAQTRGYIKYHSSGKYTGYIADDNIEEAVAYFNKWYGPETFRWLEQFRYKDKDQLELLTTVDMAVQDLVQNDQEVSVASVKALIQSHDEWRAKLERPNFSDDNIDAAIRLSEDLFRT